MQIPVSRKECAYAIKGGKLTALWCRRMWEVQKSTQLCMSQSPTSHHKCKTRLGEPTEKAYPSEQHQRRGEGGWDALLVLSDKSKRSQTGITVHNTCTKTHEIETFFFFLKKGCTSAPCSMRHLKLTLQVLQLQPLPTHRDVASGYRHEVRGSSVPLSVSTSPLILHSCGKGNDNKTLGILPTLTRTSQQKSPAHAVITNMPATVDARSLVPQEQERNNNNNNKRMILPCSSQHMLHFSLLQRHVYDACRKSVLLCAEEKLWGATTLDVSLTFSIMPVQPQLLRYAPKTLHLQTQLSYDRFRCLRCNVSSRTEVSFH